MISRHRSDFSRNNSVQYIYISICKSNGWTDRVQFFVATHTTQGNGYGIFKSEYFFGIISIITRRIHKILSFTNYEDLKSNIKALARRSELHEIQVKNTMIFLYHLSNKALRSHIYILVSHSWLTSWTKLTDISWSHGYPRDID